MKSKDEGKAPELFKFASGAIQTQRFLTEVQPAWNEFSKTTIEEFAAKINSSFAGELQINRDIRAPACATQSVVARAYVYLCNARHLFAKEKSQMQAEKACKYGRFAKSYAPDTISFFIRNPWESPLHNAFARFLEECPEHTKTYEDKHKVRIKLDGEDSLQFSYLVRWLDDTSRNQIEYIVEVIVIHPSFPEEGEGREKYFERQFAKADLIFQKCINWQPEDGHEAFLVNIARLCHFFAVFEPLDSGNSAIVEWMIRGIGIYKGLELGPFNWDELGWDFKAFLTPNVDDYVEWFVENALPHFAPMSEPLQTNGKASPQEPQDRNAVQQNAGIMSQVGVFKTSSLVPNSDKELIQIAP
ncbi:LidE [Legionella birminghamensis]|uniref:LidE n=1 Tax=Legionella birminghamensis TaxID=28083 RepID=A0A378IAH2_9GAMM|nr:hypothetical protein [Legionella birminghamensis]KTC67779.1 LidE [Legionella birminghamensis]STX32043.1 LidE [Legionella birminghamensis]